MWSNECSAERDKGKKRAWCYGMAIDKWKPVFIDTYKGKDLRVMVWAIFWGEGKWSEPYIMDRDFESKKHGYSVATDIKDSTQCSLETTTAASISCKTTSRSTQPKNLSNGSKIMV